MCQRVEDRQLLAVEGLRLIYNERVFAVQECVWTVHMATAQGGLQLCGRKKKELRIRNSP
jgi:hypothetical protein